MPDSKTNWCSHCLPKGIHQPAQVDWPGIPLCRECMAETVQRVTGEPAPPAPTTTGPRGLQ